MDYKESYQKIGLQQISKKYEESQKYLTCIMLSQLLTGFTHTTLFKKRIQSLL